MKDRTNINSSVSPAEFIRLLLDLQHDDEARRLSIDGAGLEPEMAVLRLWQSARLRRTYADLLAHPGYQPACEFFLTDVYGPRDFSQRDHDAERLYAILSRFLPDFTLRLLADAIRLNRLSDYLDNRLLRVLVQELGVTDTITTEAYTEAYQICDNYEERKLQIQLIVRTLNEAAYGARSVVLTAALRLARGPALHLGWFEVYDFIKRGAEACRPMPDVGHFINVIEQREMMILERIFSDVPEPFELPD
jgi:hypothetical protein